MDKAKRNKLRKELGANISKIRKSKGMTLEKLAYWMGLSKGNLSEIESGKKEPMALTLFLIAQGLEVPISKLFADITIPE